MKIKYMGSLSRVVIEAGEFKRGEIIEVGEEQGAAIIASDPASWQLVSEQKKPKPVREDPGLR
jgi:hypothetical protein